VSRRVVVLIVLLSVGRALAAQAEKTSPTVARETADSNARTPAGRRYESAFQSSLDPWLRPALERCVKSAPKDDLISFDALVRVSSGGEAEEVLLTPETAVGRCIEPDFRRSKYPSPPEAGWWVRVQVGLK
jgi:hypothetical protein